jgi:hypothetical protein
MPLLIERNGPALIDCKRTFSRWAALAAALALFGCASKPPPAVPIATPPPGKALLYVLNTDLATLLGATRTLYDGDLKIATISDDHYRIFPLYPGRYTFTCGDLPLAQKVMIEARAGQVYFMRAQMGSSIADQLCEQMTSDVARKALRTMTLQGQN